jgi:hypothetical protein
MKARTPGRRILAVVCVLAAILPQSCATATRKDAVPDDLQTPATVLGFTATIMSASLRHSAECRSKKARVFPLADSRKVESVSPPHPFGRPSGALMGVPSRVPSQTDATRCKRERNGANRNYEKMGDE